MPSASRVPVGRSPFTLINKGSPSRNAAPSLSPAAKEFVPSPPGSPISVKGASDAAPKKVKNPYATPKKSHDSGGAAAPGFTFPESPSIVRASAKTTAAASYRSKVKSGSLAVDQAERDNAKAVTYDNWSPSSASKQGATDLSKETGVVGVGSATLDGLVADNGSVKTVGYSSDSSDGSVQFVGVTPGKSKLEIFKKTGLESDESVSSASTDCYIKEAALSYDSLLSNGSGSDEALLLAQYNREKAAREASLQDKVASATTVLPPDETVLSGKKLDSPSSVADFDATTERDKSVPGLKTTQDDVSYPPQFSGSAFFDPKQKSFGSFSPVPEEKAPKPSVSKSSSKYNPPDGSYSRKLTADSVTYFSLLQLEATMKELANQESNPSDSAAHHTLSPFRLVLDPTDNLVRVYNCKNDFVCVMGPKPQILLEDHNKYTSIASYKFKRDVRTSFEYPTYVLGQSLQVLCFNQDNAMDSPAHPSQGPFCVRKYNGANWIFNSKNVAVWELPCLSNVADPSRPWLGDLPSSARKDPVASQLDTDPTAPSKYVSSKRHKLHNAKEMETDPTSQSPQRKVPSNTTNPGRTSSSISISSA